MKYLLFSGSLRKESLNKKLITLVSKSLSENKSHQVQIVDLKGLSIPVYDGDVESAGIPDGVTQLGKLISDADAVIIASPEYNGSIAGSLKNVIDWVSRLRPVPLAAKPILLMGASPGYFGSIKALGHTRAPFEVLGSYVLPQTFALPKANEAFTATGDFVDESNQKKLATLLLDFTKFADKLKKD